MLDFSPTQFVERLQSTDEDLQLVALLELGKCLRQHSSCSSADALTPEVCSALAAAFPLDRPLVLEQAVVVAPLAATCAAPQNQLTLARGVTAAAVAPGTTRRPYCCRALTAVVAAIAGRSQQDWSVWQRELCCAEELAQLLSPLCWRRPDETDVELRVAALLSQAQVVSVFGMGLSPQLLDSLTTDVAAGLCAEALTTSAAAATTEYVRALLPLAADAQLDGVLGVVARLPPTHLAQQTGLYTACLAADPARMQPYCPDVLTRTVRAVAALLDRHDGETDGGDCVSLLHLCEQAVHCCRRRHHLTRGSSGAEPPALLSAELIETLVDACLQVLTYYADAGDAYGDDAGDDSYYCDDPYAAAANGWECRVAACRLLRDLLCQPRTLALAADTRDGLHRVTDALLGDTVSDVVVAAMDLLPAEVALHEREADYGARLLSAVAAVCCYITGQASAVSSAAARTLRALLLGAVGAAQVVMEEMLRCLEPLLTHDDGLPTSSEYAVEMADLLTCALGVSPSRSAGGLLDRLLSIMCAFFAAEVAKPSAPTGVIRASASLAGPVTEADDSKLTTRVVSSLCSAAVRNGGEAVAWDALSDWVTSAAAALSDPHPTLALFGTAVADAISPSASAHGVSDAALRWLARSTLALPNASALRRAVMQQLCNEADGTVPSHDRYTALAGAARTLVALAGPLSDAEAALATRWIDRVCVTPGFTSAALQANASLLQSLYRSTPANAVRACLALWEDVSRLRDPLRSEACAALVSVTHTVLAAADITAAPAAAEELERLVYASVDESPERCRLVLALAPPADSGRALPPDVLSRSPFDLAQRLRCAGELGSVHRLPDTMTTLLLSGVASQGPSGAVAEAAELAIAAALRCRHNTALLQRCIAAAAASEGPARLRLVRALASASRAAAGAPSHSSPPTALAAGELTAPLCEQLLSIRDGTCLDGVSEIIAALLTLAPADGERLRVLRPELSPRGKEEKVVLASALRCCVLWGHPRWAAECFVKDFLPLLDPGTSIGLKTKCMQLLLAVLTASGTTVVESLTSKPGFWETLAQELELDPSHVSALVFRDGPQQSDDLGAECRRAAFRCADVLLRGRGSVAADTHLRLVVDRLIAALDARQETCGAITCGATATLCALLLDSAPNSLELSDGQTRSLCGNLRSMIVGDAAQYPDSTVTLCGVVATVTLWKHHRLRWSPDFRGVLTAAFRAKEFPSAQGRSIDSFSL